jgi:hypothetical protein
VQHVHPAGESDIFCVNSITIGSFSGSCFVRSVGCATPSKLIDRGVAQRPVEPGHDRFDWTVLLRSRNHLFERGLQDVL